MDTWRSAPVDRRRAARCLASVSLVVTSLACGAIDDVPDMVQFIAQCLPVDDAGELVARPTVCKLDSQGRVVSEWEIELALGLPYAVDRTSARILAISASDELIDVTDGIARVVGPADSSAAYGVLSDSTPVALGADGRLRTADGAPVQAFPLDGAVDVNAGVDIVGDQIVFTVEQASGTFSVVVGDLSTGEVREIFARNEFVGSARWSPDGTKLAFVGPDYRSILVTDAQGAVRAELTVQDPRLSGRIAGPRWVDDDTIVAHDAVPGLIVGTVSGGAMEVMSLMPVVAGGTVAVFPVPVER